MVCSKHATSLSIIIALILQTSECLATNLPFDTGQPKANNNSTAATHTGPGHEVPPKQQEQQRNLQRVRVIASDPSPWLLPLGQCVGDCDLDNDCEDGLICFQRDRYDSVPGCLGGDRDGSLSDYCIRPIVVSGGGGTGSIEMDATSSLTTTTTSAAATTTILGNQQYASSPTKDAPAAGMTPTNSRGDSIVTGNGVAPSTAAAAGAHVGNKEDELLYPWIEIVGNNIFGGKNSGTLQKCQGDCDIDEDCAGDLICFQRQRYQPVFGCRGGSRDKSEQDYCIDRDAVLPPSERSTLMPPYTSTPFRLKQYWQPGYRWQEESRERQWCMMYNYKKGSNNCWYGLRKQTCHQDAVYISKCSDKESRQIFIFLRLKDNGGELEEEEVLIRIANGNLCLERSKNSVILKTCNEREALQHWMALNGNVNGYRFELSQKYNRNACLTQAHHPKEGEVVELHSCAASREDKTSYWNVF